MPREIWVLVASAVIVSLGFGIVAPVLTIFASTLGATTFQAGVVVSAFALTRLVFAPLSGRLSTRFGERSMYMLGIGLVGVSSVAAGLANDYSHLVLYRGLGGVGSVIFSVSAMSLIFRVAPAGARGRASALYGAGWLVGNIGGPAIGAFITPLGYRAPFFIYAGSLFVAMFLVGVLIRPDAGARPARVGRLARARRASARVKRAARRLTFRHAASAPNPTNPLGLERSAVEAGAVSASERAAAEVRTGVNRSPMSVREAWADRRFRAVLVSSFAEGWTDFGVRVSLVPLLAAAVTSQAWVAGGIMTAFAVGNGLALIRAGVWSDYYGRRPLLVAGLTLSGVFTIGFGWIGSVWLLIAASFLAGIGAGFVMPSQQGAVADVVGARQGSRVFSFFQQAGDLGQILGPVAAGWIADVTGFGVAFAITGAMMLISAAVWYVLGRVDTRAA